MSDNKAIAFDEYKRRLDNYSQQRDLEFNKFLEDHADRVPKPKDKKIIRRTDERYQVKRSIKFWLALVAGVCAVGAAGLRVYQRIFQVASAGQDVGINTWLPSTEAWLSVGAVNIGLVALSFTLAYQNKRVSNTSLWIGVIVAAIISLFAGLGQSFVGLNMVEMTKGFDWILALSLALISALEWSSGDMMGVESVIYEIKKAEALKNFEKDFNDEEKRFEKEEQDWLVNARRQFGLWKVQFNKWNGENYSEEIQNDDEISEELLKIEKDFTENEKSLETEKEDEKMFSSLSKADQAYSLVKKFVKEKNRLPSTKEIVEQGYSVGLVSYAINKFIAVNSEILLKNGLATNEKIIKAQQSFEKRK